MSYSKLVLPLALVASLGVARGVRAQAPADDDASDEATPEPAAESSADNAQQPDQEQVSALLDDEARTRFRLGTTLYRQGRFADAAREFRAAYEVSHRPELLYNLYLVERDAGNIQEAADALRTYLSDASEIPDRGLMEGRLAALDRQLEARQATDADTTDAADATDETDADATDETDADATDETDADETTGPPVSSRSRVLPLTLMIAGGAVVLVGTAFAFAARSKYNTLDSDCTNGVCLDASSQGDIDALRQNAGLADLSFILGGASLITGVILFLLRGGHSEEPAVSAGCGPSGCGLSMQGSF